STRYACFPVRGRAVLYPVRQPCANRRGRGGGDRCVPELVVVWHAQEGRGVAHAPASASTNRRASSPTRCKRLFHFMAQLCVTVTAPTLAELRARRDAAAREADMVELRLDTVADPDPDGALAGRTGPVIVTCRASWEGGHFRGSEAERLRLLERAWRAGADFVDIEWQAWSRAPWIGETGGERLVVSHHDFSGVPDDLQARYSAMAATGAAVVKLAVTARALRDCVRLLDLLPPERRRHVLVGMGAAGLVPRLLPDRFGSAWPYAGDGVAPGQVPDGRMREEFRFGEVSVGAALYGLAANPAGHS